jgi:hypothetical protein
MKINSQLRSDIAALAHTALAAERSLTLPASSRSRALQMFGAMSSVVEELAAAGWGKLWRFTNGSRIAIEASVG